MSLLDRLFGGLFDIEEESAQIEHPCANCPSSCTIAPNACPVCQPYKEKMIDAIYRVEHKDEIISQYEVVGTNAEEGTVVCPNCGGHSENHYVCDYCGSKLQEGSKKIQVASASEIPNPVLEAQDLIFSRYDAVKGYAGADSGYGYEDALSGIGSQGLFSSIFSALLGGGDDNTSDSKSIGKKMTEKEIEEMAAYYNVSVSDYLTGLDNGKYLTLSNKSAAAKAEEKYTQSYQTQSSGGMGDFAGLAGAMGLGSMLFGGSTYNREAARKPYQKPGRPGQPYPGTSAQASDPKLNHAGAGKNTGAAQIRKEAQEREAELARKEAQARKAAQARKEEQARREAQARKEEQARREALARREEQSRREALAGRPAANNADRLDAGKLKAAGRREAPAPAKAVDARAGRRPENVKSFSETRKDPDAKAPGKASGLGRRQG